MSLSPFIDHARRLRRQFDESARREDRAPWSRLELAQGFAADVGELQKLCMIVDGRRQGAAGSPSTTADDSPLAHELADCLWSVLVLADEYGVDLTSAYPRMIAAAEAKLTR
ncbi:hypothetical protein [Actomonas aquatica]|uniref:Nucleotide pyrophosphohydrolase n=1 Tax=Actomonas aquatica TaxID=2866162 RepID=A0ABZ1C6F9_9BACT|nr:hypothetical protein [Opitutus sp. WL0086]WRQ87184.1 hypothetical protein K1X11_020420 [Opitutus sp. WL0086]